MMANPCKTILTIEDERSVRENIVTYLEDSGYIVLQAENGRTGLEVFRHDRPDLILVDLRMPEVDGLEVLAQVTEESPETPIIVVSGTGMIADAVEALRLGAWDYILKPIHDMRILEHAVCKALEQARLLVENRRYQEYLEQRTAELESANHELKSFAYIVSHDLKAPLRGIARLAHWIVEDYADVFDEHGKEMVGLLVNRVKLMDSLIDGILQYSRVGRIVDNNEEIDLDALVREVIDMIALPEHIQVVSEHELPTVVGDRTRFEQVFQNLLSNAVKYMDKPEGKITIGCVDEGSHWKFSVADNGPGIEKKHYEKIFQIFQTLTPRDERESTGIGLTLVKKIIELYGGKIWVESTVGKGSTFFFTLLKN